MAKKPESKTAYIVDAEREEEMVRLVRQGRFLTAGMGGVFPENLDLENVERVLDLACGPGEWALEVAFQYRDIEVVGMDISEKMTTFANAHAAMQQRENVSFLAGNILNPLPFPDASFDLVNARMIVAFTRTDQWVPLLRECIRILRPGGIVRFTEVEIANTNKPHYEKAFQAIFQAMSRVGMVFSPQGVALNVISMLPGFFREVGLERIGKKAHVIDYAESSDARDVIYQNMETGFPLIGPFLEKMGISTQKAWDDLRQQALLEIYEEDFRSMWFILTVWGYKCGVK